MLFIHMQTDFYITKNIAPYVCQLYLLSNIEYDVRYNLDCANLNLSSRTFYISPDKCIVSLPLHRGRGVK